MFDMTLLNYLTLSWAHIISLCGFGSTILFIECARDWIETFMLTHK